VKSKSPAHLKSALWDKLHPEIDLATLADAGHLTLKQLMRAQRPAYYSD
jgi:hypothetical protein